MASNIRLKEAQSVSNNLETQSPAFGRRHSAQFVAEVFVKQYYNILYRNPNNTHRFYKEESTLSRPDVDGSTRSFTTMKEIAKEIKSSGIKQWDTILLDVKAQNTLADSLIIGVLGFLRKDTMLKYFSQTFLLAPQTRGYYVHNDFFQFIDSSSLNIPNSTAEAFLVLMKDKCTSTKDNVGDRNQVSPNNVKDTTTKAPHKVLEKERNGKSKSTKESTTSKNYQVEDVKKNPYVSIVTKTISFAIPPQPDQQVLADQPSTSTVPPNPQSSFLPPKPNNVPHSVKTILVKDLPPYVTRKTLTHAVKCFGSVKHRNIDIRRYMDGYGYAFVEFNQPKSARLAVQAGVIKLDDWECQVEAKRAKIEGL